MTRRRVAAAWLIVLAPSVACKTTPASDPAARSAEAQPEGDRAYNVITREELYEKALLGGTALAAVQRLRPSYLIDKTAGRLASGQPFQVSINDGQLTDASALGRLPVTNIAEIRYLTTGEAAQHFRNRANGPVILITLMSR